MRGLLTAGLILAVPAAAREPLLLRIRPNDPAAVAGNGGEALLAARARAAREAIWERSDRRARLAIASVCTGCLKPRVEASPLRGDPPAGAASAPPRTIDSTEQGVAP